LLGNTGFEAQPQHPWQLLVQQKCCDSEVHDPILLEPFIMGTGYEKVNSDVQPNCLVSNNCGREKDLSGPKEAGRGQWWRGATLEEGLARRKITLASHMLVG
jgi:hypothetical protein